MKKEMVFVKYFTLAKPHLRHSIKSKPVKKWNELWGVFALALPHH